MKDRAMSLSRS